MSATDFIVFSAGGASTGAGYTPDGTLPPGAVACTAAQAQAWQSWGLQSGKLVAVAAPAPTLAQQARAMLAAGCQVASTGTPALNATYACDDAAQAKINRVYGLIQRAGGSSFPAGLTELPWPDASGAVHTFKDVPTFLAFETAIGDFVLALELIVTTGAGTLPTQPVTIA